MSEISYPVGPKLASDIVWNPHDETESVGITRGDFTWIIRDDLPFRHSYTVHFTNRVTDPISLSLQSTVMGSSSLRVSIRCLIMKEPSVWITTKE